MTWLLIGHDKPKIWVESDFERARCCEAIQPRRREQAKSCWALASLQDSETQLPPNEPTLRLHAASMYVIREHHQQLARSEIKGFAFLAAAVPESLLEAVPGVHIVDVFRDYHGALKVAAAGDRVRTAESIYESGNAKLWKFAQRDLLDLIESLLGSDLVAEPFRETVRGVLRRCGR